MPIPPDMVPRDPCLGRGVRWVRSHFSGSRMLIAHDAHGNLVAELRVVNDAATPQTEQMMIDWLDEHYPAVIPQSGLKLA